MTNIEKMQKTPELQAQYNEWLKNPMTRIAIETVRELYLPVLHNIEALSHPNEVLAAKYAEQAGLEKGLQSLLNLNKIPVMSDNVEVEATWETDE